MTGTFQEALLAKHTAPAGWPGALPATASSILEAARTLTHADGIEVKWTTVHNVTATVGKTHSGTWRDLGNFLGTQVGVTLQAKLDGSLWSPAEFDGGRRKDDKVVALHAMALDCDARGDWQKILAWLREHAFAFIAHRSMSSTVEKPKWRVILPLVVPFTKVDEWGADYNFARVIVGAIGDCWFDPSCGNPARLWFGPVSLAPDLSPRELIEHEGFALDLAVLCDGMRKAVGDEIAAMAAQRPLLPAAPSPGPRVVATSYTRAGKWLACVPGAVQGANADDATYRVACKMVKDFALSAGEAFALMEQWAQTCEPVAAFHAAYLREKISNAMKYGTHPEGDALNTPLPARYVAPVSSSPSVGASVQGRALAIVPPPVEPDPNLPPQPVCTPFVTALMGRNPKFLAHWHGRGKTNGDISSGGYDWTVAQEIIAAGGSPDDVIEALLARPDRHAFNAGETYARKLALRAQKHAEKIESEYVEIESLSIQDSSPPVYSFVIKGFKFDVSGSVLLSRSRFAVSVMESIGEVPRLPTTSGGLYADWVNDQLKNATHIEMPPDASTPDGEREEIEHIIHGLPAGDAASEGAKALDRGAVVSVPEIGETLLMRPLFASVRSLLPNVTRPRLTKILREIGWLPATITLDGKQLRVWKGIRAI